MAAPFFLSFPLHNQNKVVTLQNNETDCNTADDLDGTARDVVTTTMYSSEVRREGWCTV